MPPQAPLTDLSGWPGTGWSHLMTGSKEIVLLSPREYLRPKVWTDLVENHFTFLLNKRGR